MRAKNKRLNYEFEEIPKGFVRMKMCLTFDKGDQEGIVEHQILKMLVRDYYILYSKKNKFDKWVEFDFYCQPQHETMIAYRFGIYAQIIMDWDSDKNKTDMLSNWYLAQNRNFEQNQKYDNHGWYYILNNFKLMGSIISNTYDHI